MKNIAYRQLYHYDDGSGFTNQIFVLITNILFIIFNYHYNNGKNIIICGDFLKDLNGCKYINSRIPISNIINIDELNRFLYNNYNVLVFDKNDINFDIISVIYGTKESYVDVTNYIKKNCLDKANNKFMISKQLNFNKLFGDPSPGIKKKLFIKYSINEYEFDVNYDENMSCISENIEFDVNNNNYELHIRFPFDIDESIFFNILQNIPFKHNIIMHSDNFIKNVKNLYNTNTNTNNTNNTKINVLHLRLENDAINYWSKCNSMGINEYKEFIENKYIEIIKNNISDKENNIFIILGYSNDNNVIKYLKNNNYKYYICEKIDKFGREINAIIDLHNVRLCNNLYIGNFSISKKRGSSFGYFILSKLNKEYNIKSILLDLDDIKSRYEIYDNYCP